MEIQELMKTVREKNWRKCRKWWKRIIEQFKKQIFNQKFEKHEDIWKKIEENNIGEIWEMFEKNMKKILKLERNSERNFREIIVKYEKNMNFFRKL